MCLLRYRKTAVDTGKRERSRSPRSITQARSMTAVAVTAMAAKLTRRSQRSVRVGQHKARQRAAQGSRKRCCWERAHVKRLPPPPAWHHIMSWPALQPLPELFCSLRPALTGPSLPQTRPKPPVGSGYGPRIAKLQRICKSATLGIPPGIYRGKVRTPWCLPFTLAGSLGLCHTQSSPALPVSWTLPFPPL